jgi:hypothetical protein
MAWAVGWHWRVPRPYSAREAGAGGAVDQPRRRQVGGKGAHQEVFQSGGFVAARIALLNRPAYALRSEFNAHKQHDGVVGNLSSSRRPQRKRAAGVAQYSAGWVRRLPRLREGTTVLWW